MAPNDKKIRVESQGMATVVHFVPTHLTDTELDAGLRQELLSLGEIPGELILDFSGVGYVASSVLGTLIVLHKRRSTVQGTLKLSALSNDLRDMLHWMKLDSVFTIVP